MNNSHLKLLPMHLPSLNESKGTYRPYFFDLSEFKVKRLEFHSHYYNTGTVEPELVKEKNSFYYLREDKLRVIDIIKEDGTKLPFDDFTSHFGIKIKSANLFKTGKYISRVFRPVKYGGFFRKLNIHISNIEGKKVDGISLISLACAKALGWKDAEAGKSAQFTLFFHLGLGKGHCVVSDRIQSDIVIYGYENIKETVQFIFDAQYITLEPVKLSPTLRMDIQSLLNLFDLFGSEQYLLWAYKGIQQFKEDLLAGRLEDWLDNFDSIDIDNVNSEQWTIRKAIWHKIDYTKYPGLLRAGWTMFRNSILTFSSDKEGKPVFHIPVPEGKRGYIRVDLRNHDKFGNFKSSVERKTVELDKYGNLWVHQDDIELFMLIKGGADQDDGVAVIPVEDNKALIYRNPNQYGEYGIYRIVYNGIEIVSGSQIVGTVPIKDVSQNKPAPQSEAFKKASINALFNRVIPKISGELFLAYNKLNLLRAYCNLRANSASIGLAANAEMLRTALIITDPDKKEHLFTQFDWNLEKIIDAQVKEGFGAQEDMEAVNSMFEYLAETNIEIPKALLIRIPERLRRSVTVAKFHPLDELLEALKMLLDRADLEILGRGSHSRGNRIPGVIDFLQIPISELGEFVLDTPYYDLAVNILKGYNREIAILLESTKDLPDADLLRQKGVESIQTSFLAGLQRYDPSQRMVFASVWAYEIYKTASSMHDSILWIADKKDLTGTADNTINMLVNLRLGMKITQKDTLVREYSDYTYSKPVRAVRVWDALNIAAEDFADAETLIIESGRVLIKESILKLGDECKFPDGVYRITNIAQSVSKKDTRRLLKNSLAVYIE